MSEVPEGLKYTSSHEWVRREDDGSITVGVTDHAQELLGDLVYVELPEPGRQLGRGQECAVVESVKAASDVYSPVSGEVAFTSFNARDNPRTTRGMACSRPTLVDMPTAMKNRPSSRSLNGCMSASSW